MPMLFIVSQTAPDRPVLYTPPPQVKPVSASERRKQRIKPKPRISTDEILRLRNSGVRWREIEKLSGMTYSSLQVRLKKVDGYEPIRKVISKQEEAVAIRLRSEGKTWDQVARDMGRSLPGLYKYFKRKGLI